MNDNKENIEWDCCPEYTEIVDDHTDYSNPNSHWWYLSSFKRYSVEQLSHEDLPF